MIKTIAELRSEDIGGVSSSSELGVAEVPKIPQHDDISESMVDKVVIDGRNVMQSTVSK